MRRQKFTHPILDISPPRLYSPHTPTPDTNRTATEPLRPLVHRELDELDDLELDAIHRLILRLRLDRSLDRLNDLADAAREQGALDRLPEIIAHVRARRRARA